MTYGRLATNKLKYWFLLRTLFGVLRPTSMNVPCARIPVFLSPERKICQLETDGTVWFAPDANTEELKTAITLLLRQREKDRQSRIEN
jgi:hypothetical protein